MAEEAAKFEQWAVVEIFGHNTYAGFVTEQTIGGCAFVRVDVPETEKDAAFTKLFGNGAIYSLTPCSEEIARAVAAKHSSRPLSLYMPELFPPAPVRQIAASLEQDREYADPFDDRDPQEDEDPGDPGEPFGDSLDSQHTYALEHQ